MFLAGNSGLKVRRSFLKKRTKKLLHIGSRLLKHRKLIFKSILFIFSEKKSLLPSVNALADVSIIDSFALFYHSVGDIRGRDVNGRLEYPNPNWPRRIHRPADRLRASPHLA